MTKIKICGLTTMDDIQVVNEVLPDYIGFVFAKSKRRVEVKQAEKLKNALHSSVLSVGVFVQEPMESIVTLCKNQIIDLVQLHGEEPYSYIEELRSKIAQPIIYARRLQSGMVEPKKEEALADFLLYDTAVNGAFGGTGVLLDYKKVPKGKKPIFLAGGLTPENVREVIQVAQPYCVDVSSGVETDGKKDADKIRKMIEQVRMGKM